MPDTQSEAQLEADLVTRLEGLGYDPVSLPDMGAMQANLRAQLGTQNGVTLSDGEFAKVLNHFSDGSVDGTDNTKAQVGQLGGDTKLIVTTIQKLNTAISRDRYEGALQAVKDQRVVFIFDECHRSQLGDTHKRIVQFFSKALMFGFTGTPIFADNAVGKRTTKDLFTKCLHKYVITDAIADENVLRFSVEYWGKLKRKDGGLIDEDVPAINVREFLTTPTGLTAWLIGSFRTTTARPTTSSSVNA